MTCEEFFLFLLPMPYPVPSTLLGVTFQKRSTILCKYLYSQFETYKIILAFVMIPAYPNLLGKKGYVVVVVVVL